MLAKCVRFLKTILWYLIALLRTALMRGIVKILRLRSAVCEKKYEQLQTSLDNVSRVLYSGQPPDLDVLKIFRNAQYAIYEFIACTRAHACGTEKKLILNQRCRKLKLEQKLVYFVKQLMRTKFSNLTDVQAELIAYGIAIAQQLHVPGRGQDAMRRLLKDHSAVAYLLRLAHRDEHREFYHIM